MCRFLKTLLSFKNLILVAKTSIWRFLFVTALFSATLVAIIWQTYSRNFRALEKDTFTEILQEYNITTNDSLAVIEKTEKISQPSSCLVNPATLPDSKNKELMNQSQNTAITQFQQWLDNFSHLSCLQETSSANAFTECGSHDPRILKHALDVGEKLSVKRKEVFSKIIQKDPRKALKLAIPSSVRNQLPASISRNIETWQTFW